MTDRTGPRIAPPPSVDDVLSALTDNRIGQVEFTATAPAAPAPTTAAPAAAAAPATPAAAPEPGTAGRVKTPKPRTPKKSRTKPQREPVPEPISEAVPEPVSVEEQPIDEQPIEEQPIEEQQTRTVAMPPVVVAGTAREAARETVTGAVEEIAGSVVARIRAAEQAALRHLEAVELEATRRYELVTAQAELDAELIRLQARREAHSIVTAAHSRADEPDRVADPDGGHDGPQRTGRRHLLSVLSDAVSRVADTTETSLTATRSWTPGNGA